MAHDDLLHGSVATGTLPGGPDRPDFRERTIDCESGSVKQVRSHGAAPRGSFSTATGVAAEGSVSAQETMDDASSAVKAAAIKPPGLRWRAGAPVDATSRPFTPSGSSCAGRTRSNGAASHSQWQGTGTAGTLQARRGRATYRNSSGERRAQTLPGASALRTRSRVKTQLCNHAALSSIARTAATL
jgi:hypothetical protein